MSPGRGEGASASLGAGSPGTPLALSPESPPERSGNHVTRRTAEPPPPTLSRPTAEGSGLHCGWTPGLSSRGAEVTHRIEDGGEREISGRSQPPTDPRTSVRALPKFPVRRTRGRR
jgi:hypothetical protein